MDNPTSSVFIDHASNMTPAQLRMARAALRLDIDALALKAGVNRQTIMRMEADVGSPRPATVSVIRTALEASGIRFIGETGVEVTSPIP